MIQKLLDYCGANSVANLVFLEMTIQVLIPARNPTEVILGTVESLVSQTDMQFSVLISDNYSTTGQPYVNDACNVLRKNGILVELVRPPRPLGRVEHWNWIAHESAGDIIKPLFVGDSLAPIYMEALKASLDRFKGADIVTSGLVPCTSELPKQVRGTRDSLHDPQTILCLAAAQGNTLGGPSNVAIRRSAFIECGGFSPALPVSADFCLFLQIALRGGVVQLGDALIHFNRHPDRFSSAFPIERIFGDRELVIALLLATSSAQFTGLTIPFNARNRFFLRLFKRSFRHMLRF